MPSGAGETSDRRRRGVTNLLKLSLIYISLFLVFCSISKSFFPQNPITTFHEAFFSKGYLTDGRAHLCSTSSDLNQISDAVPLANLTTEASQQSSCSSSLTTEQELNATPIGSRSGLAPAPPLFPSHWFLLMAGASLGPSGVPFPVGTPTAHGELKSWRMVPLDALPSHFTPILQNGGDLLSHHPPPTTLWFVRIGLVYHCCPLTPLWPISRSDFFIALLSLTQNRVCWIMVRLISHLVIGALSLEKTSLFLSRNHMDIALYLLSDANLLLNLCGVLSFSNIMCCVALQATILFPDLEPSFNPPRSVVDKSISSSTSLAPITSAWSSRVTLGSRTLAALDWLVRYVCRGQYFNVGRMYAMPSYKYNPDLTSELKPMFMPIAPMSHLSPLDCKLGSVEKSQSQTDYKLCVDFLNLHGFELHVREDPPALLRFDAHSLRTLVVASARFMRYVSKRLEDFALIFMIPPLLARSPPSAPSVEHSFTSSNALLSARAAHDHLLVKDLVKLGFKDESALVPVVFSNILKLVQVENPFVKSMELLSFCCFVCVISCCKNSPLFEVSA